MISAGKTNTELINEFLDKVNNGEAPKGTAVNNQI